MTRKLRKGYYVVVQRDISCAAKRREARKPAREALDCRLVLTTVLTVLVCGVAAVSAQAPLQADADSMRGKVELIVATGDRQRDEAIRPVHTSFTEQEVNAYLEIYGPTFLPQGLNDPQLGIGDAGRVVARGIVDLDAVRLSRQRDWLDPVAYLTGLLEFTATGVVSGSNGKGMVLFESATLAEISVPKNIVQELVRYYTTTPEKPNGFDLDEPVELPANIQSVLFEFGRATIIQ